MPSPPVLSHTPPRHRRWWLRALKWLAVTLGLLAAAIVALAVVLANWPDSDPPDDADMLPQWSGLGDDNPLAQFETWLEENPFDSQDPRLLLLKDFPDWDTAGADALVADRAETLAKFQELASAADQPWAWKGGEANADISQISYVGTEMLAISQMVRIEAVRLAEAGQVDLALERCLDLVAASRAAEAAEGTLTRYLPSLILSGAGIRGLWDVSRAAELAPEQLRTTRAALATMEPAPADFAFAIRCEYLGFRRAIDDVLADRLSEKARNALGLQRTAAPYLQRNDTLRLYLGLTSPIAESLEHGDWQSTNAVLEEYRESMKQLRSGLPWTLIQSNPMGTIMVSMATSITPDVAILLYASSTRLRIATTMLALREFELAHGRLPGRLEELAPSYLHAIPLDPFTSGQPLRWDAATGALYSVGADGVDDGGAIDPPTSRKAADYGAGYWWAPD